MNHHSSGCLVDSDILSLVSVFLSFSDMVKWLSPGNQRGDRALSQTGFLEQRFVWMSESHNKVDDVNVYVFFFIRTTDAIWAVLQSTYFLTQVDHRVNTTLNSIIQQNAFLHSFWKALKPSSLLLQQTTKRTWDSGGHTLSANNHINLIPVQPYSWANVQLS